MELHIELHGAPTKDVHHLGGLAFPDTADRFYVAYIDGVAAGYAAVTSGIRVTWVNTLYVAPDMRRRGVATALIQEICGALDHNEVLQLECYHANVEALALYKKCGFTSYFVTLQYGGSK